MLDADFNKLSPEMQDTYLKYCLRDNLDGLDTTKVILSKENRDKIDQFIIETKYKDKFIKYGLGSINRIINYGASGTGKTFLTKCLAGEFKYELLALDINNALDTGMAASAIERVFELGNHIGRCIIFLDECDVIARNRSDKSTPLKAGTREAINGIFQLLDRMNPQCIFVAATNLYEDLDPAFVRRFDLKLKFERPAIANLQSIIEKFLLKDFHIKYDMDPEIKSIIENYAKGYTSLSYDEIENWVERSEKKAIIADTFDIKESDIYGYFMESLSIKISEDEEGKPYIYRDGGLGNGLEQEVVL